MRSPVHFQSLEQELEPVAKYLTGHLLNAGCGTRDIEEFLRSHGTKEITRFDIASADPRVITGEIESMPFGDASFDSVLCNAVLEHVVDAERGIRELARVVRKGGYLVVTVPFLQPYHPSPGDFRRYTADGLAQLGRNAGLELIEMLPVHTLAQTIGWITWEHGKEAWGRIRRAAAWILIAIATRLFSRTDRRVVHNANTYQAVFRRPSSSEADIIGTSWRHQAVPAACANVPTMLVPDELRLLHHLTANVYRGEGAIIDAGCFLGGSTIALADGLRRNPRGLRGPIHSYDRFEVEEYMRGTFFPAGTETGASFRAQYENNIAPWASLVEVHAGDITQQPWNGGPIEILFIDLAKHWRVCDWITWQFFPHLIPGRSLVVQQDYLYHHWVGWLHVTMELYADCFEYVCDTEVNSVVFLNTKKVPVRERSVDSLSREERASLADRAAARFEGAKRELILAAKAHFLEMA